MVRIKCGLEIHQQLDCKKLFCECPSIIKDGTAHFTVMRKLRAVVGETGQVDVAAAQESMKGKMYVYEGFDFERFGYCSSVTSILPSGNTTASCSPFMVLNASLREVCIFLTFVPLKLLFHSIMRRIYLTLFHACRQRHPHHPIVQRQSPRTSNS